MEKQGQGLMQRDFVMVIIGQVISIFGNAVVHFALPLYLLRETGSSALFGMVSACAIIPLVVFALFGGVIADRVNKRNIMVALDFFTGALMLFCYLFLDKVSLVPLLLVVLMLLYGIAGAYSPAVQASIPLLVEEEKLMQGNAVMNMVNTLANLLGPVVGGALFGAFGIVPILVLSAICFTISAVMEIFIRIPYERRPHEKGMVAVVADDLRECWAFMRNEKPVLLSTMGVIALFNMVLSSALAIGLPVIVVQVLDRSDLMMGITESAMGLGGLAGGLIASVAAVQLKRMSYQLELAACAFCVGAMGLAILPGVPQEIAYWLVTGLGFLMMIASTFFSIGILTTVQEQTPILILGKVMALAMAISNCAQPVGQAIYGVMFERLRQAPSLVLFCAAALALLIGVIFRRTLRQIKVEEKKEIEDAV